MQAVATVVVTLSSLCLFTFAIPIDNGVKGYPHVTCGPHSVIVDVDTERPFQGRIFVKGEAHRPECVRSFGGGGPGPGPYDVVPQSGYGQPPPPPPPAYGAGEKVGLELKFGDCNMRRQRTLHPRGVEYTFTMVISFHPLFLTKVDRAYRVRCFYMEAVKTVNAAIDVSMLTTHQLNEQFPMPTCTYHLRRGIDGPYIRFAKVGDKVTHVWQCDKVAGWVFGMLVHSCFVDDGAGNKVQLVDEKGCAVDRHLVPQVLYDDLLITAHAETHVFKYADKQHLFFSCTIQLCFKNDGGCQGITPPSCGGSYAPQNLPAPVAPSYGPPPPVIPLPQVYVGPQPGPYDSTQPDPYQSPPEDPEDPSVQAYGRGAGIAPPPPPPPSAYPSSAFGPPNGPVIPQYGPPNGPRLPPYKDQPIRESNDTTTPLAESSSTIGKVKRAIETNTAATTAEKKKQRRADLLEADLTAEPLVVLPFDLEEDDDTIKPINDKLTAILPPVDREYRLISDTRLLPSICLSPSGFGLFVALFIMLVLFSSTLTVIVARRNWLHSSKV